MSWFGCIAVTLLAVVSGCGPDCAPSADIQILVRMARAGDGSLPAIDHLRFDLNVAGGSTRSAVVAAPVDWSVDHTVLLRPDPAPADHYQVALTVAAFDAAGAELAIGAVNGDVVALGCNRLTVTLAPLSAPGDFGPGDGDMSLANPDLLCDPGGPDEDGDGHSDSCDACPADSDVRPMDGDGDGLPDACDPDPLRAPNSALYFDPFNVDSGHWSGARNVTGGELVVSTGTSGTLVVGDDVDLLPVDAQVQLWFNVPFFIIVGGVPMPSDFGIFVGTSANPATASSGVMCALNHVPSGTDTLSITVLSAGSTVGSASQPLQPLFITGNAYRLRFSRRGGVYRCEAVTNGAPTTLVAATVTTPPPAPLKLALHVSNLEVHVQSLFVASTLE